VGVVKMVQLTPALPELSTAQPQLVSVSFPMFGMLYNNCSENILFSKPFGL
jgi:hypothetical protein